MIFTAQEVRTICAALLDKASEIESMMAVLEEFKHTDASKEINAFQTEATSLRVLANKISTADDKEVPA